MKVLSVKRASYMFQKIYADMPLPMILTFLEIADSAGMTVSGVEERVGISHAAASRHCRGLTDVAKKASLTTPIKLGYDLVDCVELERDYRSRIFVLNENGKKLVTAMSSIR